MNKIALFLFNSGMLRLKPIRSHYRSILDAIREECNLTKEDKPLFREFITKRKNTSNKFHYFAVFKANDEKYISLNAYGRIGYPARFFLIGNYSDVESAINAAKQKIEVKIANGYKKTTV